MVIWTSHTKIQKLKSSEIQIDWDSDWEIQISAYQVNMGTKLCKFMEIVAEISCGRDVPTIDISHIKVYRQEWQTK